MNIYIQNYTHTEFKLQIFSYYTATTTTTTTTIIIKYNINYKNTFSPKGKLQFM